MSENTEFEDGRYLYCAVGLSGTEPKIEAQGVDEEPVRVLAIEDIGIVVHDCDSLYDSDDMDVVRKWVLQHQQVVDAAGEAFGTPLPFQFDTILTGDDGRVREWVLDEQETISEYLDALAGHWEYRIELRRDESKLTEELETTDERLQELGAEIDDAGSGTEFLLEKQYDKRLTELKRERRAERSAALEDRLTDLAREVNELGDSTTPTDERESEELETQARFTVLAAAKQEETIGEMLDEVAAESGVEVRFTGPWPPYSFVPAIGGENATESGG
ncbi:MAG TPA: GvpL/GvpF family gas vesicle protein [Halococcus sp.]|nr:GvpL/GvpF family gas vesicle protein [Halococcus sp.]